MLQKSLLIKTKRALLMFCPLFYTSNDHSDMSLSKVSSIYQNNAFSKKYLQVSKNVFHALEQQVVEKLRDWKERAQYIAEHEFMVEARNESVP